MIVSGTRANPRLSGSDGNAGSALPTNWTPGAMALAVCLAYYAGARIGLSLTFMPFPLAVLWPPNALLLAALLLAPKRWWWLLLLSALPAHLFAELKANIPLSMALGWFATNVSEALVGALLIRLFSSFDAGLRTVRSVLVFCFAVLTAALLSSFLDAGLVRFIGWGAGDFWTLWQARLFTNTVSSLIFVPVIITCMTSATSWMRHPQQARILEAAILLTGLLAVGAVVFGAAFDEPGRPPSLLYLPMPFLIWAALRFGPPLTALSFAIVAFLVIWGAGHGHGPFLTSVARDSALPIQLFLITIAVPLMLLAALIEERRLSDQQVRASQKLFSTVFRAGPDAIAVSRRADGMILEANDRWLDLFAYGGHPPGLGRVAPLASHADGSQREQLASMMRESANVRGLEVDLRDCTGGVHQVLVSITAIELGDEACAISIVHDISELRHAEGRANEQHRQLTHLTRVASLTDFSSTLAHELNQPLTAILSNAQAALRFLARDPPDLLELRSILTEIADADKRAGLLIHHLRLLLKRGDQEFVAVDLNQMARTALTFAHGTMVASGTESSSRLSKDLPRVNGDPIQLQQLLLNLISNACDAMREQAPGRRRLSVSTLHTPEGKVQIDVSDSGPGLTPDEFQKVFQPFFTTKEKGLGLGLPICREIAQVHGGTLEAESREGGGASFRLVLPPMRAARRAEET